MFDWKFLGVWTLILGVCIGFWTVVIYSVLSLATGA